VTCEPQVVVGAEHDYPLAVDDRFRAFVAVECLVEGIETEGLCLLDQAESAGLVEDVPAGGVVVAVEGQRLD
jgi:hypothetical protein